MIGGRQRRRVEEFQTSGSLKKVELGLVLIRDGPNFDSVEASRSFGNRTRLSTAVAKVNGLRRARGHGIWSPVRRRRLDLPKAIVDPLADPLTHKVCWARLHASA